MKVFVIYPNIEGYGRIPTGLAIISTILMDEGHDIELFDTTFMSTGNKDNDVRNKAGLCTPTDLSHLYTDGFGTKEIRELLKERIMRFQPDLICLSIVEDNYEFADELMGYIKTFYTSAPILCGGTTPTVAPHILMANPNIDYIIQGEGEGAIKDFCEIYGKGEPVDNIPNLWYTKGGRIKSNPIRPLLDMNTLPIQNFDIWDEKHYVKPYDGVNRRAGPFETSRGCMLRCSYCVNVIYQDIFKDAGKYKRFKTIDNTIAEIKALNDKHNFDLIFFADDNFLAMPRERLEEFSDKWSSEVGLPYWINSTISSINEERIKVMKETNCAGIGLGIETGSESLRKNILKKSTRNVDILERVNLIHDYGIRTTANVMIGFPGETVEDIFESIEFMKELGPDSFDLNFVAPYIGTPVHQVAKDMGWIDTWDKPGFKGMAKNITMRQNSVINLPTIDNQELVDIFYKFTDLVDEKADMKIDDCTASRIDETKETKRDGVINSLANIYDGYKEAKREASKKRRLAKKKTAALSKPPAP